MRLTESGRPLGSYISDTKVYSNTRPCLYSNVGYLHRGGQNSKVFFSSSWETFRVCGWGGGIFTLQSTEYFGIMDSVREKGFFPVKKCNNTLFSPVPVH